MKILKRGILWALIARWIYLITKNPELKKEIDSSSWWKQAKSLWKDIKQLENDLVKQAQGIDYKKQREEIKILAHQKEKLLQSQLKKLKEHTNKLWEKKINEIIWDIQESSEEFISQTSTTISQKIKRIKPKATSKKINKK